MEVINRNYEHYNRALGKYIKSKRHYEDEMKRQGMVSFEKGEQMAKDAQEKMHKDYKPNDEMIKFFYQVKGSVDKNGHLKLSGRQISYMEKMGVDFKRPEDKGTEGGFE